MIRHRYSKYIPGLFLFLDLLCFNIGYWFAFQHIYSNIVLSHRNITFGIALSTIWVITFFIAGLNKAYREASFIEYLNKISNALVINPVVVLLFWMIIKPEQISKEFLFYTYLIFAFGAICWRVCWFYFIRIYRARGFNFRRVAVLGNNSITTDLIDYIQVNGGLGYRYIGSFDNVEGTELTNYLGTIEMSKIKSVILDKDVDILFIYTPLLSEFELKEIVDFAENNLVKIKLISTISQIGYSNLAIQNFGSIPTINITALPLDRALNKYVKRFFDLIFSLLVLIFVFSWLIPIIGIMIKLESKGPIFFRQDRNGLNNKPFSIYKFRTMVVHEGTEVKQAHKGDNRITRLGAFLRKSSLDEIPQFLNVFLGEMSVVGPRPHAVKHNEEFRQMIDRFIQRHAVKPGITGLAQAKGFRGETVTFGDINSRVRLDKFYVKNWSMVFDIKIIFLTMWSILKGSENAY